MTSITEHEKALLARIKELECQLRAIKSFVAYMKPVDIEYLKLPGCRIVEVSNVSWDVFTVPLYKDS